MVRDGVLKTVRFKDMSKWSVHFFKKIKSSYPLVPLFHVLKRVKEPVIIKDNELYKRITVRLYGQGVIMRDELYGSEIGTKKQFVAREGQLIISRIDARNGAFGIVPKELDGAIVTNDFWLFTVQHALARFLTLLLSSERFQQYWETQSSGTTNRQRVDENSFLSSKIALPPLDSQEELLNRYDSTLNAVHTVMHEIDHLVKTKNEIFHQELSIDPYRDSFQTNKLFDKIKFSQMDVWGHTIADNRKFYARTPFKVVKIEQVCKVNSGGTPSRANPEYYKGTIPWLKTTEVNDCEIYDTDEKITESAIEHSSARLYPAGSVVIAMYGHTRGKTAILRIAATTNQACAVLHDISTDKVLPEYLWLYMQSQYFRIRTLAVGSAQPNLNAQTIKSYPLVLPPVTSSNANDVCQECIIKKVQQINKKINDHLTTIDMLKTKACSEFEEAIFGEA